MTTQERIATLEAAERQLAQAFETATAAMADSARLRKQNMTLGRKATLTLEGMRRSLQDLRGLVEMLKAVVE